LTAKGLLFSGFEKHILKACNENNICLQKLILELEKHNLVAGQEDLIYVIANSLK
jgi:hypothetical protein